MQGTGFRDALKIRPMWLNILNIKFDSEKYYLKKVVCT